MPTINKLPLLGTPSSGDQIPVYAPNSGDARRMSITALTDYMQDTLDLPDNSDEVSFLQAGTGAVQRTVQSKLRDVVSVKDFGAVGDGVTDDTAAIQAAIASSAQGLDVFFPTGTYKVTSAITLPTGRAMRFSGTGAGSIITSTGLSTVFYRNTRGDFVEIDSLVFTGSSPAFYYDAQDTPLPWNEQFYEYKITNCRFLQFVGTYHLKFHGAREGLISNCYFQNGDGIYTDFTINCEITNCIWKNTTYGIRAFTGTEGVRLVGSTMLGCGIGIWFGSDCTGLSLVGSMIDYCDIGVQIDSATAVDISGCYISSRTIDPALFVIKTTATVPSGINVVGNTIRQNSTNASNKVVRVQDATDVNIIGNKIENYRNNGIEYSSCASLNISYNTIRKNPSYAGQYAIAAGTDSATNKIHGNIFDNTISATLVTDRIGNTGEATTLPTSLSVGGAFAPPTPAGALQGNTLSQGTGAPNNANGANGDIYFRADGSTGTTIYHKRVGSWVAIV